MYKEDFVAAMKYLVELRKGEGILDDIDHLGSRRVRTVGELLANQCRVGLARTERLVKERMTLFDAGVDTDDAAETDQSQSAFGRRPRLLRPFSQLTQFMDQINPLAELTHKRRLSALGPGGLIAIARASRSGTFIRRTTDASARSKRRKARTSA